MDPTNPREADVPRLIAHNVSKTYGSAKALVAVNFEVRPGELHGLVGQNGSGKSTLIKVFTGYHAPDVGTEIIVDGEPVSLPITAAERRRHGISVVHQNLGLVGDMSVTENVRIGNHRRSRLTRRINWRYEAESTRDALARLGSSIDPRSTVSELSAEDRATVAIARAMQDHEGGTGLIIFDESTRPLTKDALERFYEVLDSVRRGGTSVLMISHRLEEVLQHSDRISVLRDGTMVESGLATAEVTENVLVAAMLGRELETLTHAKPALEPSASEVPRVRVSGLSGELIADLDLSIGRGEVVGITGLTGSGFEEVPYLLAGAKTAASGTLAVDDWSVDLVDADIRTMIDRGVALVPEERAERGICLDLSIEDNITIPRHRSAGNPLWIGMRWRDEEVAQMVTALGVRPQRGSTIVGTLSGGNQQKVLLAKWLAAQPSLLLLAEPTQAVDVGARADIVQAIFRLAKSGASVLVAAGDPGDLAAMCHRVVVIQDGRVVDELVGAFDQDAIVATTFAEVAKSRLRPAGSTSSTSSTTTRKDPSRKEQTVS